MKDDIETLLQGGHHRPGAAPGDLARRLLDQPQEIPRLAALLNASDPGVRCGAAEAMAILAEESPSLVAAHVASLAAALDHEETRTRLAAYRSLAAVAAFMPSQLEDDLDVIGPGVFDPAHPEIRRYAALCLGHHGAGNPGYGRRAFPHLAEAVRRFHDRPRATGLFEGIAALAMGNTDDHLRKEIWKAVRPHEKHPETAVRNIVEGIAGHVRRDAAGEETS